MPSDELIKRAQRLAEGVYTEVHAAYTLQHRGKAFASGRAHDAGMRAAFAALAEAGFLTDPDADPEQRNCYECDTDVTYSGHVELHYCTQHAPRRPGVRP